MLLFKIIEACLQKNNQKHKTKAQIQNEKDARERLIWELSEEYEDED